MLNKLEIQEKLQKTLSIHRFNHSLGVAYTAASLAMRYGIDIERAFTAGLLHDCAKNLTGEEMIEECKKNKIEITTIELSSPSLLHAKLGEYYAKTQYGILDLDVLSAIRWHTTGRPNMNILEEIIYISDYIEPNRSDKLNNIKIIRKTAFEDIKLAVFLELKSVLEYLKEKECNIDDITKDTYSYYKNILEV